MACPALVGKMKGDNTRKPYDAFMHGTRSTKVNTLVIIQHLSYYPTQHLMFSFLAPAGRF